MNVKFLTSLLCILSLSTVYTSVSAQKLSNEEIILLAANSSDDGKSTKAGQARAHKMATQRHKDISKVLSVRRLTGGYMVKVLKAEGRVQEVWIKD